MWPSNLGTCRQVSAMVTYWKKKPQFSQVSLIWIWTLNGKDHNNYPFVKPTTVNHVRAEVLFLNDIKWFEMYYHRDQKANKSW